MTSIEGRFHAVVLAWVPSFFTSTVLSAAGGNLSEWVTAPQRHALLEAAPRRSLPQQKARGYVLGSSFDIPGPEDGGLPQLDVAATRNDIVCCVGGSWIVLSTTGAERYRVSLSEWFSPLGVTGEISEPYVVVDPFSGRWLLFALSVDPASQASWYLLSVSDDSNPLGRWWGWRLNAALVGLTDSHTAPRNARIAANHPEFLLITSDQYGEEGSLAFARLRLLRREEVFWKEQGAPLSWRDNWNLRDEEDTPIYCLRPAEGEVQGPAYYMASSWVGADPGDMELWEVNPLDPPQFRLIKKWKVFSFTQVPPPPVSQAGTAVRIQIADPPLGDVLLWEDYFFVSASFTDPDLEVPATTVQTAYVSPSGLFLGHTMITPSSGFAFWSPAVGFSAENWVCMAYQALRSGGYLGVSVTKIGCPRCEWGDRETLAEGTGPVTNAAGSEVVPWGRACAVTAAQGECGGVWVIGAYGTGTPPWTARIRRIVSKPCFRRGDTNADGRMNIADGVTVLRYLFGGGTLPCEEAADANGDWMLNLADAIAILSYLFGRRGPLREPFETCGPVGLFSLPCESFPPCM